MGALEKAKLQEVSADANERAIGDPVPVQFNPSSLKLKLTNQMEGGRSTGRVRRQQSGAGKTVLSMELVFDTADEGTDESPVSVRAKTAIVERYVVPNSANSETPPRLRFEWNDLVISGIVESLDIDFDLFAANGTPLRAKVSLSIKEQEPKYQLRSSDQASPPGAAQGAGGSDRSAPALDGETPAEFAARNGLDPSAWRGLDVDLSAGLSLSAGIEVGFSASLSASAGIGITAGFQAGLDLSLEAALGLSASAAFSADASASAGLALSAAGGVSAAIETAKIAKSDAAAGQARQDFAISGGPAAVAVAASAAATTGAVVKNVQAARSQSHTPLTLSGSRSFSQQQGAEPAPPMPRADTRSSGYGFGVPLRPLYPVAVEQQQPHLGRPAGPVGPPLSGDPSTPPWLALSRTSVQRDQVDRIQARKGRCPGGAYPGRSGGKR